jgi:hypothetical protein
VNYQTFSHSFAATGNGSRKRFVTFAGAQAVAADVVLGVARTDFKLGDTAGADILGVTAVEAGGPIAAGVSVVPDAQGRAIADPMTGGNLAANSAGRSTNAVTAAGQTVLVFLK